MGPPELQPPPPALEWTEVAPAQRFVSKRLQECNFLQAMEGGIDSSHVSWLHGAELNKDPLFKGSKGNEYNEQDRMPLFEVEEFSGGLLIGARRNAEGGKYYWRITPWIMPWYTIIPPRAGHPLGAHAWVPIDDETCWAWSINYHPKRALDEVGSLGDAGRRGHPRQIRARHFHPARQQGEQLSDGPRGAAARPFLHRRRRHRHAGCLDPGKHGADPGPHERASVRDRQRHRDGARMLLRAAKAAAEGGAVPATDPAAQRVRSASVELAKDVPFTQGAQHGLYAPLGTDPLSV